MYGHALRPVREPEWGRAPRGTEPRPLPGAAWPARERLQAITGLGVGVGRGQETATRDEDQPIANPARGDQRRAAGVCQRLAPIVYHECVVAPGGERFEARVVERRMQQRCRRRIERLRANRDPGTLREQPAVHDPTVERAIALGVSQDDDAIAANPLAENREVADRQRIGEALWLAPTEDEHSAVARQIGSREVGVIAAG